MLRLGASVQSINARGGGLVSCYDPAYVSNFLKNSDGWGGEQGIATFTPGVTIGGLSPVLQLDFAVSPPGAIGAATTFKMLDPYLSPGCTYSYSLQYYIPASNVNITFLKNIIIGEEVFTIDTSPVPTETWLTRSGTVTLGAGEGSKVALRYNTLDAGGADSAYLYDINISLV